jgi:hypothetical protein
LPPIEVPQQEPFDPRMFYGSGQPPPPTESEAGGDEQPPALPGVMPPPTDGAMEGMIPELPGGPIDPLAGDASALPPPELDLPPPPPGEPFMPPLGAEYEPALSGVGEEDYFTDEDSKGLLPLGGEEQSITPDLPSFEDEDEYVEDEDSEGFLPLGGEEPSITPDLPSFEDEEDYAEEEHSTLPPLASDYDTGGTPPLAPLDEEEEDESHITDSNTPQSFGDLDMLGDDEDPFAPEITHQEPSYMPEPEPTAVPSTPPELSQFEEPDEPEEPDNKA